MSHVGRAAGAGARAGLSDVEAVVLVGGQGTRLRPLTVSTPKPLLPLAGVPFLEHMLTHIRAAGIRRIILATAFQAEIFRDHFGDGSSWGIDLEYVTEETALGTAGAVRNVVDRLRAETTLVCNGDILSDVDLVGLIEKHRLSSADVTLRLLEVADPSRFGCVPTDENGWVTAFLEKTPNPPTKQINGGCYVFRREILERIPVGKPVSIEHETFPELLDSGVRMCGVVDDSYWLDLGTPESFVQGSADLVRGVARSPILASPPGEALLLEGASVAPDAVVAGGSTVSAGSTVDSAAQVNGSVLLEGAHVASGAVVERSVVGPGARIGEGAVLRGAVVGEGASIGAGCELLDGLRVWPAAHLPAGSVRFSSDV